MFSYLRGYKSSWETLKECDEPIAVYGTGDGADKVFHEFERLGIVPKYVVASDGFARERTFHGYKVMPISELEKTEKKFTVALAFASGRPEVIENIKNLSQRCAVLMPSVPVYGNEIFNKEFLLDNLSEINSAYEKLADEASKEVFKSVIEFQITGNLNLLFSCETEKDEALSLLGLNKHEDYLDLGAYRGDTVQELNKFCGGYNSITAVEPDKRSYNKLCAALENMQNTASVNAAVSGKCGVIRFGGNKGRGGSVAKDGEEIKCVTVDSLGRNFTYIKADVEGEEAEMLRGAENALKRRPKLNIAAYHRSRDIFALVNEIKRINSDYEIYIRHHRHISLWDTNLYCK